MRLSAYLLVGHPCGVDYDIVDSLHLNVWRHDVFVGLLLVLTMTNVILDPSMVGLK